MPPRSTLARLQQVITLWILVCALWWALAWWPLAPGYAVLGAIAIAWGHAWILGIEFLMLRRVRRGDPAPRAAGSMLARAWWRESVVALRVFGWRQPFDWRRIPDRLSGDGVAGRHGVVFIHGFLCNRGFWTPWRQRVEAMGRAHVSVNLEPVFTSIEDYVPLVEDAIQRVRQATGLPPVLVCHSMGGIVARAWLRVTSAQEAVAHVVTIGSPHAGTWLARFSHTANGRQMRQDSEWTRDLQRAMSPSLAARFTCWWTNCDNIVMPPSTATLPGADNRFVPGAAHVDLAFRHEVVEGTLALLEGLQSPAISGSALTRS